MLRMDEKVAANVSFGKLACLPYIIQHYKASGISYYVTMNSLIKKFLITLKF